MFFVIEGIDGSGKTSVGKRLGSYINVNYIETPTPEFKALYGLPNNVDPDKRFDYYMMANQQAIAKLDNSKFNFVGRYYFSTIIGSKLHFNLDCDDYQIVFEKYLLAEPLQTVLLTVSETEQLRRIKLRNCGKNDFNDRKILDHYSFQRRMRDEYLNAAHDGGWKIIDTTHRSIDAIADEIFTSLCLVQS